MTTKTQYEDCAYEQCEGFDTLYDAINKVSNLNREVADNATQLARTATAAVESVRVGGGLNSLGEIQGNGSRLDVAIALREEAFRSLRAEAKRFGLSSFAVEEIATHYGLTDNGKVVL